MPTHAHCPIIQDGRDFVAASAPMENKAEARQNIVSLLAMGCHIRRPLCRLLNVRFPPWLPSLTIAETYQWKTEPSAMPIGGSLRFAEQQRIVTLRNVPYRAA